MRIEFLAAIALLACKDKSGQIAQPFTENLNQRILQTTNFAIAASTLAQSRDHFFQF